MSAAPTGGSSEGASVIGIAAPERRGRRQRVRMQPENRKAIVTAVARDVFADNGYASSGLAEIAARGHVSKTLLYHYFPGGRPEMMLAVIDDLVDELVRDLEAASAGARAAAPLDGGARIAAFVSAFIDHFAGRGDAFRLLFRDPWGSGDPEVSSRGEHVHTELAAALAAAMNGPGPHGEDWSIAALGVIGMLVTVTDLVLGERISPATGAAIATRLAAGGLERVGTPSARHAG